MATSTAKAGPYISSTANLKFSTLRKYWMKMEARTTFSGSETFLPETGPVSASDLVRITESTGSEPNVPDATENTQISSRAQGNWKPTQFVGAIKYYYLQQTGVDLNYNIGAQAWNSNITKTITKKVFLNGSCGSTNPNLPACKLDVDAKNVRILVAAGIYGAGGAKRTGTSQSGTNGGTAFSIPNISNILNNVIIEVGANANIYGGGAGGGSGGRGGEGGDGGSYGYSQPVAQVVCRPGWVGPFCGHRRCWGHHIRPCHTNRHTRWVPTSGGAGGSGGGGGDGGFGAGFSSQQGTGPGQFTLKTSGQPGQPGTAGQPGGGAGSGSGPGGDGGKGGDGGRGGSYGQSSTTGGAGQPGKPGTSAPRSPGQPGTAGGPAGAPAGTGGASISGSNYYYTGTITSLTVKGNVSGGTEL